MSNVLEHSKNMRVCACDSLTVLETRCCNQHPLSFNEHLQLELLLLQDQSPEQDHSVGVEYFRYSTPDTGHAQRVRQYGTNCNN